MSNPDFHFNLITTVVLFLLYLPALLLSQSSGYHVQHFSTENGLSDNLITQMLQHSNGFLWIGTEVGLNRFDGYEFVAINELNGNAPQLQEGSIKELFELPDGRIFITYPESSDFADIFDPGKGTSERMLFNESTGFKGTYLFGKQKAGRQYFIGEDEHFAYIHTLDTSRKFKCLLEIPHEQHPTTQIHNAYPFYEIMPIQESGQSWLMLDTRNGLRKISRTGRVLKKYDSNDFDPPPLAPGFGGGLCCGKIEKHPNGSIFIRFNFDFKAGAYTKYLPEQERFIEIDQSAEQVPLQWFRDERNNLVITRHDIRQNKYSTQLVKDNGQVLDLSGLQLSDIGGSLFYGADLSETIFVISSTGLIKIAPNPLLFKTYLNKKIEAWQFNSEARGRGIVELSNDQMLFMVDEFGWYLLDTKTGNIHQLQFFDQLTQEKIIPQSGSSMVVDKKGTVWTCDVNSSHDGVPNGKIYRWQPGSKSLAAILHEIPIATLVEGRDGMIWVTGNHSNQPAAYLARFNPQTERFTDLLLRNQTVRFKTSQPTFLLESKAGQICLGTQSGVYLIDPVSAEIQEAFYSTDMEKAITDTAFTTHYELSNAHVMAIHESQNGLLWVGTMGGINILNPKTGEVRLLNTKDGLSDNRVCGILEDEEGMWFATWKGLSFYDEQLQSFHNFFTTDGLPHNEFNRYAFYKDKQGRFYLGGMNGFISFHPKELRRKKKSAKLLLSEIGSFDKDSKTHLIQNFNLKNEHRVVIPPKNRNCYFKFGLTDFTNPSANTFSYRLQGSAEGLSDEWIFNGSDPQIRFDYLPSGTYTLQVRATDSNGNPAANEKRIQIYVRKFFYQTVWFLGLCMLTFLTLIWWWYRYRLAQVIKLERMRTRISSDLHDEVGGLLSGVAFQMELLEYSAPENQKDFIHKIGNTSRKAMSKMRDVVWAIDARKDRLEDLLDRMKEFAQELLDPLNIHFRMELENLPMQRKIPSEVRHNLILIYKEFLTNTVKHAHATEVLVQLAKRGAAFEMHLEDNGQGLTKNYKTTGQGLANMKMRAERIGAVLEFVQQDGFGIMLRMKAF